MTPAVTVAGRPRPLQRLTRWLGRFARERPQTIPSSQTTPRATRILRPAAPPRRLTGCGAGKTSVVAFDAGTVPNRPKGLARLAAAPGPTRPAACEATGGYEAALLQATLDAPLTAPAPVG